MVKQLIQRRSFFLLLFVLLSYGSVEAQIVLPHEFEAMEGTVYESAALGSATQTAQAVYGQRVLLEAGIFGGARITGISFRADQSSMPPVGFLEDYQIRMATSLNPPGQLDPVFSVNRGPDFLVARAGPLMLDGSEYPVGESPNEFGTVIHFDMPFDYWGGDLLLEYTHTEIDPCKFEPDCLEESNADAAVNVANVQINFGLGYDVDQATFFEIGACTIVRLEFVILGDMNCDGVLSLLDVAAFVESIVLGEYDVKGDINNDGTNDLLDIGPFVELLAN